MLNITAQKITVGSFLSSEPFVVLAMDSAVEEFVSAAGKLIFICDSQQKLQGYLSAALTSQFAKLATSDSNSPLTRLSPYSLMTNSKHVASMDQTLDACLELMKINSLDVLPVLESNGQICGFVGLHQLLAVISQREQRLKRELSRLEIDLQRKDEYLGILSHDIRTPLSVISLCADYMLSEQNRGRFSSDDQSFLERIQRNVDYASNMAKEIMQVLSLEKQTTLHCHDIIVEDFVEQIVANLQIIAAENDVLFDLDCEPDILVSIDTSRMQHVIENLLMNAIKFSPKASKIWIRTKLNYTGQNQSLSLSIRDEGPGIPLEELPFLFEKFKQGKRGREAGKGVGLGLAIAKKFTELHGGQIEVDGGSGTGAIFTVSIPGARSVKKQITQSKSSEQVLLFVEDDIDLREYFAEGFRTHGFDVVLAVNGRQGYQEFLRSKPDIVVTDIKMAEVDGLELLGMIRNHSSILPVVLFTGLYPGLAEDLNSLPVKADHVISKPATVDQVVAILRGLVPGRVEAS